jgi:hypothetical protein
MFSFVTYLLSNNKSQSIGCVRLRVTAVVVVVVVVVIHVF